MSEHPSNHNRRIRLLYSLKDIQLTLSVAEFLSECDPDESIGKVELRRYKCYETTAIVAYARPFSQSRGGGFPRLSMSMIGVRLEEPMQALHTQIINLRNKQIAHSDAQMMRMVVKTGDVNIGNGQTMPIFNTAFDEGLDFVGYSNVSRMIHLFHIVYFAIQESLLEDARANPAKFNF
jgi:hypothetical protein